MAYRVLAALERRVGRLRRLAVLLLAALDSWTLSGIGVIIPAVRVAGSVRLLLALVCSWQTAYQIHDRYGDTFKAVAAYGSVSSSPAASRWASPSKDIDAWVPLTLGRTLLPGRVNLAQTKEWLRFLASRPVAPRSLLAASSLRDRAPPSRSADAAAKSFSPQPPLMARPAVASLAPPAA